MRHKITTQGLKGTYKTLLASSSADKKRLFLYTYICSSGLYVNSYIVYRDNIESLETQDLLKAVEKYNSL